MNDGNVDYRTLWDAFALVFLEKFQRGPWLLQAFETYFKTIEQNANLDKEFEENSDGFKFGDLTHIRAKSSII